MDAHVSACGRYRYWLSRRLTIGERTVLFVGLNPSTADATQDDPTLRRCAGFARRWGYDWLLMGNLHALRATDPHELSKYNDLDAVGPANQETLKWMTQRADLIVAAWGGHQLCCYARTLASWILSLDRARCLGTTTRGAPKHPLYLPAAAELQRCH